jgi:hypothetical protein
MQKKSLVRWHEVSVVHGCGSVVVVVLSFLGLEGIGLDWEEF